MRIHRRSDRGTPFWRSTARELAVTHRRAPERIEPWLDQSNSQFDERRPVPALADFPTGPAPPGEHVHEQSSELSQVPSHTMAEPEPTADLRPRRSQGACLSPPTADPVRGPSPLEQ